MVCPKCGSTDVNVNVVNEVYEKSKHGCLWWILIGWWWRLLWFLCFGLWYLLFRAIVGGTKTVNVQKKFCVCQNCGHSWRMH